jgi:Flp pilus assembly protein TadD
VLPSGFRVDVPAEGPALRDAETLFRRALTSNPHLVEARLRLGHVLFIRGRLREAADELRQAVMAMDEPPLVYVGVLLLGAAEEGLGHFEDARDQYARAAALHPSAQSPYLALSALATLRGDRAGALKEIQHMFDLPGDPPGRDDPWWDYRIVQARNVETLFDRLYERLPVLEP